MSFIGIKTPSGQWLELGNTEIDFEILSPVFQFNTIPAEKSFDFNLPVTPLNEKYTSFPNRIANNEVFNRTREGYELWFGGKLHAKGNLYIIESSRKGIRISFQTTAARISKWYDYTLDGFNLGGGFNLPSLTFGTPLDVFLSTRSIGAGPYDFIFAPLYNDNQSSYPVVNNYDANNGGFWQIDTTNFKITPFFYLHFVLKELEYYLGLQHTGSFITDAELRTLVFYSPITCDNVTFFAQRFLPSIKIRDLYKQLAKLFCLSYFFSRTENTITIKTFKEIYNAPGYNDYTAIASPYNSNKFIEEKGTSLIMNTDSGDAKVVSDTYTFNYGNAPYTDIETDISYPKNDDFSVTYSNPTGSCTYRIPSVEQNGEYNTGSSKPNFKSRFLFYRGYQLSNTGTGYPYLSHDDIAWNNVTIPGTNYTLDWDGTKGLHNVWWKEYTEFKATTRLAIFKVQLSLQQITTFDFSAKIRIKNNEYLPVKLKYKVNRYGISEAELELYRL